MSVRYYYSTVHGPNYDVNNYTPVLEIIYTSDTFMLSHEYQSDSEN